MEFLKPAASPPSAWPAPDLAASSAHSRRRAPSVLSLLPHGPAADSATRTGTAPLRLNRAARALAPISSSSSPSWYSSAKDRSYLHGPEVAAASTHSLAAHLQVLPRPIASWYPAAADARLPALETYRGRARLLPLRALPDSGCPAADEAHLPALETYRGRARLLPLRALRGSRYPAPAEARLQALETYSGRPRLPPLRALPGSRYPAAAEARLPALETYRGLPPLRALPGSSVPGRRMDVAHTRTRCTSEEGANTADKKVKQSKTAKIEHMLVFSVVCLVRYAEARGILTLVSKKLKLPGEVTTGLVFLFVALKSLYNALKETKDIEEVLAYFRKIAKQGASPVQDKDGASKA